MKLIDRGMYLRKLIGVIGTPDIKVVTGVRRSGKSKLLEAFKAYVEANIADANIVHINFNLTKNEKFKDYHVLSLLSTTSMRRKDSTSILRAQTLSF